jgi:hypothetical protein
MTNIVSLVHVAYRGDTPVIISALVEDCMSLTVANLPGASSPHQLKPPKNTLLSSHPRCMPCIQYTLDSPR